MAKPEIEFRAWDIGTKSWRYWSLDELAHGSVADFWSALKDWGRYTGFKDAKGKKVFAGDIVTDPTVHPDDQQYWPVVFEYGCFTIDGSPIWDYAKWIKKGTNRTVSPTYRLEDIIVAGNIYQDKDLLG